ncbi:uncharacterized protein LOC132034641 [Lycium ferocissimum]|uniref:uncharacterized protein LOC132034641 n=1 Tax=Lycium ferocissimum TaxID=112874 RepID=UPI0028159E5D|nr:uncharacterized protein LOC132034641 [Lycium ferocissimum]
MPDLPKYDGTTDPQEHVIVYTCAVNGNDMQPDEVESVLLKMFGETLSKGKMTWYSLLPEHSIHSFEMLADAFIKAHAGAKKVSARKADIFMISQGNTELLREFVIRFQKERTLLSAIPDEWAVEAFAKGLNPRSSSASLKLKESLLEFPATTWADVHIRNESKIRVEDDKFGLPAGSTGLSRNHDRPRRNVDHDSRYGKKVISKIDGAKRPRPIRLDPSQRDMSLFCDYHGTHGHWTADSRHFRDEVARLFKDGHLREFLSDRANDNYGKNRDFVKQEFQIEPRHVINMIIDELEKTKKIPPNEKYEVTGVRGTLDHKQKKDLSIGDRNNGLYSLFDIFAPFRALSTSWLVFGVAVVPRSAVNIIQWEVIEQLAMMGEIDLSGGIEKGVMELLVVTGGGEWNTKFQVVNGGTDFKFVLGRPWIQDTNTVIASPFRRIKRKSGSQEEMSSDAKEDYKITRRT